MGYGGQNVIQHDFGFPRITGSTDPELDALYAMLVSLGATKMMAQKLMENFPEHETACQTIVDFATDGEGDMTARSPGSRICHSDDGAVERGDRGGQYLRSEPLSGRIIALHPGARS